ncbi:MAG: DegT/DnrJ/EryC1/StrS family aminotransferase, partial [Steroidobacteraceae bacterium]
LALDEIPVFVPHVGVDTLKHVSDAFAVGWLGMGALTREFEEHIGAALGGEGRHVIATNTGTSALHLALLVAGVGPGDEVITPSFNYVADQQAVTATGAAVVMCDIRDDNLGFDCAKAEVLIGPRTKALLPLHFAGVPCDQKGVYELAQRHHLRVIEDCTHAFGTRLNGRRLGSYGDLACFSFDPVKIITSIDGGAVVTGNAEDVKQLQQQRLLGVDRDTILRYQNQRAWDYDVVRQGFRYHLTNIMASVGISQIKRLEEFITSRRRVCQTYHRAFGKLAGVKLLETDFADVSSYIYSIRILGGRREKLIGHLRERKIATGVHNLAVHQHSYYREARRGDMSVTERVAAEVLTLPLHSNMKNEFVDRVIEGVT